MKKFLLTICISVLTLSSFAALPKVKIGDLYYEIDKSDMTAGLTSPSSGSYSDLPDNLIIPAKVDYEGENYTVNHISSFALQHCEFSSVEIPSTIETIGYNVFDYCDNLKKVYITDLTQWCKIDFATQSSNPCYYSRSLYLNGNEITNLVIPNAITEIKSNAFVRCSNLASVNLNNITSIGIDAFRECSGLTTLTIPNSVKNIDFCAFFYCTGLTNLTLGNSVTTIGDFAFCGCEGLTSLNIPGSIEEIGNYSFEGCINLTSINLSEGLKVIGEEAFENCLKVKTIKIPNSVNTIERAAFRFCNALEDLTLSNSLETIGKEAFEDCSQLISVTIPPSVQSIGLNAFNNRQVININISDLAAWCNINFEYWIWWEAKLYLNGKEINDLVIPEGVKTINSYAFASCNGITSLSLPKSLETIKQKAFESSDEFKKISLYNNVTLEDDAFSMCKELAEYDYSALFHSITLDVKKCGVTVYDESGNIIPNEYYLGSVKTYYYSEEGSNPMVFDNLPYASQPYNRYFYAYVSPGIEFAYLRQLSIDTEVSVDNYADGYIVDTDWGKIPFGTLESATLIGNNTDYELKNGSIIFVETGVSDKVRNTSFRIDFLVSGDKETVYQQSVELPALNWAKLTAEATSMTSARLMAGVNLSNYCTSAGIEWRRNDAPDNVASNQVSCPVANGYIVGTLRNLNPEVYYKYRPYVMGNDDTVYYGEWVGFYTGDANVYFQPEIITYTPTVSGRSVTFLGYALEGSDIIESQGFEYRFIGSRAQESDWKKINASGILMTATVEDLSGEYEVRSFAVTANGTYYGDIMKFDVGDGNGAVEIIETFEIPVVVGYYDLNGRKYDRLQKGLNIIVYSNGQSRKVMIK